MDTSTKICRKCNRELPATLEYFYRASKNKDGLFWSCKECENAEDAKINVEWRPLNDPSQTPNQTCTKCGTTYPATPEYFNRKRRRFNGLSPWCKPCDRKQARRHAIENPDMARDRRRRWAASNRDYARSYYEKNAEVLKKRSRQWNKDNAEKKSQTGRVYRESNPASPEARRQSKQRRRARKRSLAATFTSEQWQRSLDYFGGCCAACNRPINGLFHAAHADHWIPLSSPDCPGSVASNMIPLCGGQDGCNNSKSNRPPTEWLEYKFAPREAKQILARIEAYFAWVRSEDGTLERH